ncbi:MAG: PA2778 family cysteine peptidase [Bacteroidota bacterium]
MRCLLAVLCAGLGAGLVAGCSGDWPVLGAAGGGGDHIRIANVPFFPQEGFRCGAAPMAEVLNWSGLEVKPAALDAATAAEPHGVGDPRRTLADTASRQGRLAYPIAGTAAMLTELAAGHPVLVVQNLGVESQPLWNCVVAIGYDRPQEEVVVHSGQHAGKRMSLRLFERLWSDSGQWGLVVLKPGDLPAAARQPDYLRAAYSLRRAGRYWEAVQAYDAALASWPADAEALMGLGASLYLLGDRHGATEAYRTAMLTAADPLPAQAALEQIAAASPPARVPIPRPQPRPTSGRRADTMTQAVD